MSTAALADLLVGRPGYSILRGLAYREWLAHRGLILTTAAAWFIGVWVLELITEPWSIGCFGVVVALRAGLAFGGAEAAEGSEEYAFSLPATRSQRYLLRLGIATALMLVAIGGGIAAIVLDAPQALWGLAVESGFTQPHVHAAAGHWWTAFAASLSVFAISFASSACGRSAEAMRSATSEALLLTIAIGYGGMSAEKYLHEHVAWPKGLLATGLLLLGAGIAIQLGYLIYSRKDGVSRPSRSGAQGSSGLWLWLIIPLVLIILFALAQG